MAMLVTDAVVALRERLDEAYTSSWSNVHLRRWLNEGIRDIARRTRLLEDTDTVAIVSGTQEYTSQTDVLEIRHASFAATAAPTVNIPLLPRQYEGMNQIWGSQKSYGNDPAVITTYGYTPTLKIVLWPVPNRAGTLTMHIRRMPAAIDIAAGTGSIDAPEAWIEVAFDYAQYMAERRERLDQWKDTMGLYEAKIADMLAHADTINAPHEIVFDGSRAVPRWLAEFD